MTWYGYVTPQVAGAYSYVEASFVVPVINVAGSAVPSNADIWVGLDGGYNNSVEQCGIGCRLDPDGIVRYQAWSEMYPGDEEWWSETVYPVSAGDVVTASVLYTGARGGTFAMTVADVTQGWSGTATRTGNALAAESSLSAARSSAEVIVEPDMPENQLANFGSVIFYNIQGIGANPGLYGTGYSQITCGTYSGPGGSFLATWNHT